MRKIELLAPARNAETAFAAIDHGADAVYMGAHRFGARHSAGNSLEDIRRVVEYAHLYGVKVYVTLNTIIYEEELDETRQLVWDLYEIGVDALIVQDLSLLEMDLPPIPLHASTQMDNRTPEQVRWLHDMGYSQAVLARELSLPQIKSIHEAVPEMPLEVFVHGALCVSYSGQCYASMYCFGRSANRGECAQFCRLPFKLEDRDGKQIPMGKYPLSLRDMNRSEHLEQMLDAGVTSFKIEGRLKDVSYVKNVTAYYRQKLDAIIARRSSEYARASYGQVDCDFVPDPSRSFSRSFTDYNLLGRQANIASPYTPKSIGQMVGVVKDVRREYIIVSGLHSFANGDGLCYFDAEGSLQGFRVNRVDNNKLYPVKMPSLERGTHLFRNFDQEFERQLARPSATRKLWLDITLRDTSDGFALEATDERGLHVSLSFVQEHQLAKTNQEEGMRGVLSKLGDTPFSARNIDIRLSTPFFIPRGALAEWRRQIVDALVMKVLPREIRPSAKRITENTSHFPADVSYLGNCANSLSRKVYEANGATYVAPAMEVKSPQGGATLIMACHHCLRYELGICNKRSDVKSEYREPFYLVSQDKRRFRLRFDCHNCQMLIFAE